MSNSNRLVLIAAAGMVVIFNLMRRPETSPTIFNRGTYEASKREAAVVSNPFLSAYSGVYNISPDGAEAFALAENGRVSWVYGYPENGKITTVTKYGRWIAREDFITIWIDGNTGEIEESYRLKNGIFTSIADGTRYLTKRQP
jgi:hypothetical protein